MFNKKEYDRKWRNKNRKKLHEKNKLWRESESGKLSSLNAQYRKRYGLDYDGYNALVKKHRARCAICSKTEKENGKRLSVDHCHDTGKIRGILCYKCNTGISYLQDNEKIVLKAAQYLAKAKGE